MGRVIGQRVAGRLVTQIARPPNRGMELTGLKRHVLCKEEEQRPRRFSPAAHARC